MPQRTGGLRPEIRARSHCELHRLICASCIRAFASSDTCTDWTERQFRVAKISHRMILTILAQYCRRRGASDRRMTPPKRPILPYWRSGSATGAWTTRTASARSSNALQAHKHGMLSFQGWLTHVVPMGCFLSMGLEKRHLSLVDLSGMRLFVQP